MLKNALKISLQEHPVVDEPKQAKFKKGQKVAAKFLQGGGYWYLRCWLRQESTMRCVPAAQRETAILNCADKTKRCHRMAEFQEDCRRLVNVETGEKETPPGEKETPLGEKATKLAKKRILLAKIIIIGACVLVCAFVCVCPPPNKILPLGYFSIWLFCGIERAHKSKTIYYLN